MRREGTEALRHEGTEGPFHWTSVWVSAGGRTVYEDPERTLADVERDEVARMERLGATRAEAERLAARGIERGVVGQHVDRMRVWKAGREEGAEERGRGAKEQRGKGNASAAGPLSPPLRPCVPVSLPCGVTESRSHEVTKARSPSRRRAVAAAMGRTTRDLDVDRMCAVVLREPRIDRASMIARMGISPGTLNWVALTARRCGLMEPGRKGRQPAGASAFVLTEKGRQYARTLPRWVGTEKGPATPGGSGGCDRSAIAKEAAAPGSSPRVETRGNQPCAPGATAAELSGAAPRSSASSAFSAFSAVPMSDPELSRGGALVAPFDASGGAG